MAMVGALKGSAPQSSAQTGGMDDERQDRQVVGRGDNHLCRSRGFVDGSAVAAIRPWPAIVPCSKGNPWPIHRSGCLGLGERPTHRLLVPCAQGISGHSQCVEPHVAGRMSGGPLGLTKDQRRNCQHPARSGRPRAAAFEYAGVHDTRRKRRGQRRAFSGGDRPNAKRDAGRGRMGGRNHSSRVLARLEQGGLGCRAIAR